MKQRAEREVVATPRTAPVPCAQSDGLAIYCFGRGEPILFMPYPHAASVVGDPMPTAIIEGLEQANRQVVTFDPPGAGRSTRLARLDLAEMLDGAEEALQHCSVNESWTWLDTARVRSLPWPSPSSGRLGCAV
jgi:hypothetical protein